MVLPSDFDSLTIPASRYVVFEHAEHVSELALTIGTFLERWGNGTDL